MGSPNVLELTTDNWAATIASGELVVADFWAPWCGPCRMLTPTIEKVADSFAGKVKVGKVNIDDFQQLATQYGIRAIPTLLLFKDGQVADQIVGLRSKRDFKAKLDRVAA